MRASRAVLWVALLSALGTPLSAQSTGADSVRTLRAARRAQFGFERLRRSRLPLNEIYAGRCEIRVGRFCYWNNPADTVVPPEHSSVTRGRARLLATLSTLAARTPDDAWIVGQRVFYLVESGNDSAALRVARECGAAAWWCSALRGYALHASCDYAAADAAFSSALSAMPEKQRCRWRDVSLLLDGAARSAYERMSCAARESFETTLWWLSDPMYSVPGNERRTEHYARLTRAAIQADARTPYGMTWDDDFRELLVRYGASSWYSRGMPRLSDATELAVSGHDPEPSYHFVAGRVPFDTLAGYGAVQWDRTAADAQERYLPGYARAFSSLSAQMAMFRRGDSAVVVAAYEVPDDSGRVAAGGVAALALARRDGSVVVVHGDSAQPQSRVLTARGLWGPQIASVELLTSDRRAAVARTVLGPARQLPGAFAMSDLLLFDPSGNPAASLPDVTPLALGSSVIRSPRRVGLYWEVYGRADSANVPVSLTIARIDRGVLRQVARALRMRPGDSPLVLRWSDPVRRDSVTSRSVVVDLSQLAPGRYRLTLESGSASAGTTTARSWREVELK